MNSMNRKQAMSLLHAVVDNEASERKKEAFLKFIETHPEIRKEYEEIRQLKLLLARKFPKKRAPEHLRQQVFQKIDAINANDSEAGRYDSLKIHENRILKPFYPYISPAIRYATAAAVVLIITFFTILSLDRIIQTQSGTGDDFIENLAAQYYMTTGGLYIEPLFKTDSPTEAENFLISQYNMDISVPGIKGAQFAGLVMVEFLDGFETPMLEYIQPDLSETIYLFVFDLDEVSSNTVLERHNEAVKTCIQKHDFYVTETDSFHSVSWLWDNIWYTAVSSHNGYDLASLIEPLNYSP